jgi:O-acetylserine/cysteine efflux transporter
MTNVAPQHRRSALAALVTAGLLWGLTVPLSKVALGWLDPAWLAVVRFGIAAPVLAFVARGALRSAVSAPLVGWGIVGFGGVVLLQNLGIARTSVTHAALIVGAVPALVALVAVARGRSTSGPVAWAGFAVALSGVALVAGSGGESSLSGDALMLASAFLGALFIEAQSRLLPGRDPVAVTAVQMAAAAAVLLPVALAFGAAPTGTPADTEAIAVLALVTFGSLLPFALYAKAQALVPAELAGAFVNVEPLVGAAVGALVFEDPFGAGQAIGATAIVGGILLSVIPRETLRRTSA